MRAAVIAALLLSTCAWADSHPVLWRGMTWTRMPEYQNLPENWAPRIVYRVHPDVGLVQCGDKRGEGCAHIPHDPRRRCLIDIAGEGRTHAQRFDIYLHERAHCYGWTHRKELH